jgi:hypothetical protein
MRPETVSLVGVLEAGAVSDGRCVVQLRTDDRESPIQIQYAAALTDAVLAAICERVTARGLVTRSNDGAVQLDLASLVVLRRPTAG